MTDAEERQAAREELEREVQASADPVLEAGEIEACLDKARVARVWAANTAYAYGEKVVPASPEGRYFVCVEPGTSGAAEPSFPEYDSGRVSDGTCTWEEGGYFTGRLYDMRRACYEALKLQYRKDQLVDASGDGRSVRGSQRAERTRELMKMYAPVGVA